MTSRGISDKPRMMLTIADALDVIVQEGRNFRQCDHWFERLDGIQYDESMLPCQELQNQVACSIFSALVYRTPDHSDFDLWKTRTHRALKESKNPLFRVFAGQVLLRHYNQSGDLTQATIIMDSLRGLSASPLTPLPDLIVCGIPEAEFNFLDGRFEQRSRAVSKGLETLKGSGTDLDQFHLLGFSTATSLSAGDMGEARAFLSNMAQLLDKIRPFDLSLYYTLIAWEALLREDFHRAARYQPQLQSNLKLGAPFPIAIGHYIMFQIFIEQGEFKKAFVHLKKVSQLAQRIKSKMLVFMSFLAEAQLALNRGKESRALRFLRKAMRLGKEKGYVNFWVWRPKVMARLCVMALEEGIEPEYVKTLIKQRKLLQDKPPVAVEHWPWPLKVYTLGRFALVIEGKAVCFSRRTQQRPLALLKVLISFGGRNVPEEKVSHALWPEAEGDKAHDAFATTLQRLRKLIGVAGAIMLRDGRLTLDPRICWVDIWAFERKLGEAEKAAQNGDVDKAIKYFEKAEKLYQAPFLVDDTHEEWSMKLRERLQSRFLHQICDISDHLCKKKKCRQTMSYYKKGLELDDLVEGLHQRIMRCHLCLGQHAEALSTYHRLKRTLAMTFEIDPSPKTEAIIKSIRKSGK